MSPKPPEPADDVEARPADRVTVSIKVTDKMGDAFVSTDVGFSSSALAGESPLVCYRRVSATVNQMYNLRRAEVRAALGQTKTTPRRSS